MKRERHPFLIHLACKHPHGLNHDHHIRCLYGDDDVAEILIATHAQELHHRFHHSGRGVAIAAHYPVRQRAVVHSETHGCGVRLADIKKRHKCVANLFNLRGIFLIGEFKFFECAGGIHEIAGIYAHFLTGLRGLERRIRIEMHIRHQGHVTPGRIETLTDFRHVLGLAHTLGGETHNLSAGLCYADSLRHTPLGVEGRRVGH